MKFLIFVASLFLIYELSFNLVIGQTVNNEKSDCTKLYNFLKGNSEDYANSCCGNNGVDCDNEGYITYIYYFDANNEFPDINSFPFLSRIEDLQLSNIGLKEIPNSILRLTSLKFLSFYRNKIEVIPPTIQNLSKLEGLNLDINNLKGFPSEIFSLPNLKYLDLCTNKIEVIPPDIQKLSKLEKLTIHGNNIKELPNEIFNLTN